MSIVSNSTIANNTLATSGFGTGGAGAYFGAGASDDAIVLTSTISGNSGAFYGGGIFANGPLTLADSTVSDNTAKFAGGIYAIHNVVFGGSTVMHNTSNIGEASVYLRGTNTNSTIEIDQSTIADNLTKSDASGGAGLHLGYAANIKNSTIAGNTAELDGLSGVPMPNKMAGSGISIDNGVAVYVTSTAVSGNKLVETFLTPPNSPPQVSTFATDIGVSGTGSGNVVMTGNLNLVGSDAQRAGTGVTLPPGTIVQPAQLGVLRNNGGPTFTMLPMPTSPLIDHGTGNGFANDQRGPGFARVVGQDADIGATELYNDVIFMDGFDYTP